MDFVAKNLVVRRLQALREITKTQTVEDIVAQMITDKVFKEEDKIAILGSQDKSEELFILLEKAKKSDRIHMLDYHWQLLPFIEAELIVVTDNGIHRYLHRE